MLVVPLCSLAHSCQHSKSAYLARPTAALGECADRIAAHFCLGRRLMPGAGTACPYWTPESPIPATIRILMLWSD